MLQFIAKESDKYSIAEEVQMAIEGGCRWIQLSMNNTSEGLVRETALELIPMCQENEAFLIIENFINIVADLKVSGVHLNKGGMDPIQAREILGANAIVGFTATSANDIIRCNGKDIDYASIDFKIDTCKNIIKEIGAANVDMPIVACGKIGVDNLEEVLSSGVNGIAISDAIINAPDPMLYTADVINRLSKI